MTTDDLDIEQIRAEYGKALRAWHVAWSARIDWHQAHFYPLVGREPGLVYDYVLQEREELRAAEEKAYERFLAARDVLAEALRTITAD